MTMEKKRFEELKLKGREVKCPTCGRFFPLVLKDTVGGGYGVIGLKCPRRGCRATFAIEGGKVKC